MKQMTIFDYPVEEVRPGVIATHEARAISNQMVDRTNIPEHIIEIFNQVSNTPMTVKEISIKMYEKGYVASPERQSVAPRVTEMLQEGILTVAGKKTCSYSNRPVTAYKLFKEGNLI